VIRTLAIQGYRSLRNMETYCHAFGRRSGKFLIDIEQNAKPIN
jgi:hypothetical protein